MIELVGKYTTAKIFAETIEEGVYSQVYDIINCRAFEGQKVVCMPDVHVGASGPCGLVATIGNYVCPEHIGVDIGCFTENTKIQLADNRQLTFKELIEEYNNGKENYCYSINDNGNICITKINLPKYTKTVNDLAIVELDNGNKIECTLDHKFMLRDGSYKEAQYLCSGDSLMPLYIDTCKNQYNNMDHTPKGHNMDPYLVIYDPKLNKYRYIHFLADEYNNENSKNGTIRHHIDFNKLNNNPTNIKRMKWEDHWKIHYEHVKETNKLGLTGFKRANELHPGLYSKAGHIGMTKNHNTPGFTEKRRQALIKCNKEGKNYKYATSIENKERVANMGRDIFKLLKKHPAYYDKLNLTRSINLLKNMLENNINVDKESFNKYKKLISTYTNTYSYDKLFEILNKYGYKLNYLNIEEIQKIHDSIIISINDIDSNIKLNHKVKSINIIHKPNTKVYCLVNQDFNNFALSAGVFVHNCSVSMMILDKKVPVEKYAEFEHRIKNKIPFGFNLNGKTIINEKDFYKFLTNGFNKYRNYWPEMLMDLPNQVTEKWVSEQLKRLGMDEGVFYKSLGTVGGGNHFIEYDEQEDGDLAGITLHFGSRNFGVKVCKYWMGKTNVALTKDEIKEYTKTFKEKYIKEHTDARGKRDMTGFKEALSKYLDIMSEGHIKGYLNGEALKGYLMDMCLAQLYAQYNHMTVQKTIKELLIKYCIKEVRTITSTHNFIDLHDHTLRKSAIRSYAGEEMLVPFNMRDGVAICEGLSNPEWLNACAHGAGRKMSRSKAKEKVTMKEFEESMKNVYSTTVCRGTIDESPMAYKDTNEIKDLITETCKIKFMMIPKINIKAADGGD